MISRRTQDRRAAEVVSTTKRKRNRMTIQRKPIFLLRPKRTRKGLVLTSVPTRVGPTEESQSLAEKYDAQVKWMNEKGITGCLEEMPRRRLKPVHAAPKRPRKTEQREEAGHTKIHNTGSV